MKVGTISCALCGKPVDRWIFQRNDCDLSTVVRVFCHGDEDRMTISDFALENGADAKALEDAISRGGEAFRAVKVEVQ